MKFRLLLCLFIINSITAGFVLGMYDFWFWESGFYWIMNLIMANCILLGYKIQETIQ